MQSDRELLELAAKAAGLKIHAAHQAARDAMIDPQRASLWIVGVSTGWNPLTDDGDALRLAVKLGMLIDARYKDPMAQRHNEVMYWANPMRGLRMPFGSDETDPMAATRRAITRAAAQLAQQGQSK